MSKLYFNFSGITLILLNPINTFFESLYRINPTCSGVTVKKHLFKAILKTLDYCNSKNVLILKCCYNPCVQTWRSGIYN